jgi:uncharacterized coiled-coil DUF342 family protein
MMTDDEKIKMWNDKVLELKAEMYDKLKEAVEKIRAEIVELQKEYQEYGWAYDDALEIIDKHLSEVEE